MKKITLLLLGAGALLAVGFNLSGCKDEKKKCPREKTCCCANAQSNATKTLSTHDTKAVYKGKKALNEDSGTMAVFDIVSYNEYIPASEYADPQADECSFMMDSDDESVMNPAVAEMINSLEPGDTVTLEWDQVYVTDPQTKVSFPKRMIRKIERFFHHDKKQKASTSAAADSVD